MSRIKQYYRNKAAKHARERPQEAASLFGKYSEPLSVFTGALVLVTLGLVGVGVLQWRTLEKTDQTLREGQRAFVFIRPVADLGPWDSARKEGDLIYRSYYAIWENNGNSQARNLKVKLYCSRPQWFVDNDPLAAYVGDGLARILGPKGAVGGGKCSWTAEELESAKTDKKHLYVAASAEYEDIFGDAHVTMFCTEITNIQGNFFDLSVVPKADFTPCGRNCADEECEE